MPDYLSPQNTMTLDRIVKGKIKQPLRVILYGPAGIGKSTWASQAPKPIFLGAEKGTAELEIDRFPQPDTWLDVQDAVKTLSEAEHKYESLVLDTLDWLEPLCFRAICDKQHIDEIEEIPYGRGYMTALGYWRDLLKALDKLTETRKTNIILLAHSQIKPFRNPEGEDFDRYEMKLNAKTSLLLQEWADEVLFANYETYANKEKNRVRGIDTGNRLIRTTRHAAFDAKNRHDLPETMPLDWQAYAETVKLTGVESNDTLHKQIDILLVQVDETTQKKVKVALAKANQSELIRILNKLNTIISTTKEKETDNGSNS